MTSLWDDTTEALASEQEHRARTQAVVAASSLGTFLSRANSEGEFDTRLALVQDSVDQAAGGRTDLVEHISGHLREQWRTAYAARRLAEFIGDSDSKQQCPSCRMWSASWEPTGKKDEDGEDEKVLVCHNCDYNVDKVERYASKTAALYPDTAVCRVGGCQHTWAQHDGLNGCLACQDTHQFAPADLTLEHRVPDDLEHFMSSRRTAETHAPYKIEQRGDKWVVVNDIGETKGTHDSKEEAREQQKALYANVPGASEQAEKKSSAKTAAADWDIFTVEKDDEGQEDYVITDKDGKTHRLSEEAAGNLLDALNGHAAPTSLSEKFEHLASTAKTAANPRMSDPAYAAGFKAGFSDAAHSLGFRLQNHPRSSESAFAEGYYDGQDAWIPRPPDYVASKTAARPSDYPEGSRWRVVTEGAYLEGKPEVMRGNSFSFGPNIPLPVGTVVTSLGMKRGWGSDPAQECWFSTEDGRAGCLAPNQNLGLVIVWPRDGVLEPVGTTSSKSAVKDNGTVYDGPGDLPKPGDTVKGRGGRIGDDEVIDVKVVSVEGPYGPFNGRYHWDVKIDAQDGTRPYSQTWFTKSAEKTAVGPLAPLLLRALPAVVPGLLGGDDEEEKTASLDDITDEEILEAEAVLERVEAAVFPTATPPAGIATAPSPAAAAPQTTPASPQVLTPTQQQPRRDRRPEIERHNEEYWGANPVARDQSLRQSSSAWIHDNPDHAYRHGRHVGERMNYGQWVSPEEFGSTNYPGDWQQGFAASQNRDLLASQRVSAPRQPDPRQRREREKNLFGDTDPDEFQVVRPPKTTRPRTKPRQRPKTEFVVPASLDYSKPTFEQQVAAKVAKLAHRVIEDNPHLTMEVARQIAVQALSRHPGVLGSAPAKTAAMSESQVREWLMDYAWIGTQAEKRAEVDCIMAQGNWRHIDAVADQFASAQETGGGPQEFSEGMQFALSSLYEAHDGPHLPTCPRAKN